MDIIQKYEPPKEKRYKIVFSLFSSLSLSLSGWVTFTVHLAKKFNYPLYKVSKRTEKKIKTFWLWCRLSEYLYR